MPYRHDAFISYSHAVDGRLAPLLEAGLEKLAKPVFKLRAMDVFRDQTSLSASPGLWTSIAAHLEDSRWFVLLASPASAASVWCCKEVLWWLEHRGAGSLLVVLTDGQIVWSATANDFDWELTSALSPALKGRFSEEPLFVDLRWTRQLEQPVADDPRLRAAVLDLAAPIRGIPKDELDGDDVRQLRRTRRLARAGVAAISVAALLAVWQAVVATQQRTQAQQQRDRALSRQLAAQAIERRISDPVLALLLAAQAPQPQASAEASTALLRVLQGLPLERIVTHTRRLSRLAVQPGRDTLVIGDAAGGVLRLDPAAGPPEALIPPTQPALLRSVKALAVSPDGRRVAASGYAGTITLWQADAPLRKIENHENQELFTLDLAFSPDGNTLASVSTTHLLVLHDLASGRQQPLASGMPITCLAFSPDGRWLAVGDEKGALRLLPRQAGAAVAVATEGGAEVVTVAYSRDGRLLLAAFEDGIVERYDTHTGRKVDRADLREYGRLSAAALAPDGDTFVTGHASGAVVRAYPGRDRAGWQTRPLTRHAAAVSGVVFLADGRRIATASLDGRLFISRPVDVPPLFEAATGPAPPAPKAEPVSPDGRIVYRLHKGTLQASEVGSGVVRAAAKQPDTDSLAGLLDGPPLALSPDGRWLAVRITPPSDYSGAIADGPRSRLALYRAPSLTPVALDLELLAGVREAGPMLSFTPDGRWLLGSQGDALTAIDVASAQRLDEAIVLPANARPLGFAPDTGRLFVATAPGRSPLQADLRTEAWVARACRLAGRKLTAEEWRRYVGPDLPERSACG